MVGDAVVLLLCNPHPWDTSIPASIDLAFAFPMIPQTRTTVFISAAIVAVGDQFACLLQDAAGQVFWQDNNQACLSRY